MPVLIDGGVTVMVKLVLAGKNPAARADELIAGTKLYDPAERKKLVDGGKAAVDASADPMILLAKVVDAEACRLRTRYENEVEEPQRQAYAKLAEYRFQALRMLHRQVQLREPPPPYPPQDRELPRSLRTRDFVCRQRQYSS